MQQYMQGTYCLGSRSAEKELEVQLGRLNSSQQCALVTRAQQPFL